MSTVNKLVAVFGVGVALTVRRDDKLVTYSQADGKGAVLSFEAIPDAGIKPGNYSAVVQGMPIDAADLSKGVDYLLTETFVNDLTKEQTAAPVATAPKKAARQSPDIGYQGRART